MGKNVLVTGLTGFLVLVMLISGCSPTAFTTTSAPSSGTPLPSITSIISDHPVASSPPSTFTPSSTPASPEITAGQTPSPSAIPTPRTSGVSAPESVYSKLDISRAPAVGEPADINYALKQISPIRKSITRVWLEFECYDPGKYYPLGEGQNTKDMLLRKLSQLDPDDSFYFIIAQAAKLQPKSNVEGKSVVVSGNTNWEGTQLKTGDQIELNLQVVFPQEGKWIVNALSQNEDGAIYIDSVLYLVVNQDYGTIGWPVYFEGPAGFIGSTTEVPVGIIPNVIHAPLVGETLPFNTIIQSTKDINQAEISINFQKMDGYKQIQVDPSEIITQGGNKWKGKLKEGISEQFTCVLNFPSEGDWVISYQARVNADSFEQTKFTLRLHIGKEKSYFGWLEDHTNPNTGGHSKQLSNNILLVTSYESSSHSSKFDCYNEIFPGGIY